MEICVVKRDLLTVCGYCVETTSAQNDADISALYNDFFSSSKEELLLAMKGAQKGYYGLSWYTQAHERYCYLLGVAVGEGNSAPENAMIKKAPSSTYARACFKQGEDIIKAWKEFFYEEIYKAGLTIDSELNVYFEYYPHSVHGDYELWVPVVTADV